MRFPSDAEAEGPSRAELRAARLARRAALAEYGRALGAAQRAYTKTVAAAWRARANPRVTDRGACVAASTATRVLAADPALAEAVRAAREERALARATAWAIYCKRAGIK